MRRSTPVTPGLCVLFLFFFFLPKPTLVFHPWKQKAYAVVISDRYSKHKNKWKPKRKWVAENTICSNTNYLDLLKHSRLCHKSMGSTWWYMSWGVPRLADVLKTTWYSLSIAYCSTDLFGKAQGLAYYIIKPERICLHIACTKALEEKA